MERLHNIPLSFTLEAAHVQVLEKWADQSGMSKSAVVRELIESRSDCDLVRDGLFLRFMRPKFQRRKK